MQPPEQFSEEVYEEVKKIINASSLQGLKAELVLAREAGGVKLQAAISIFEFPPCSLENDCSKCWTNKWCVHKDTPPDIRQELISSLEIFTAPSVELSEDTLEKIKGYDKTSPADVSYILEVALHLYVKEVSKDESKSSENSI